MQSITYCEFLDKNGAAQSVVGNKLGIFANSIMIIFYAILKLRML